MEGFWRGSGEETFLQDIFAISFLSPLEQGHCPFFQQSFIPFTKLKYNFAKFGWNWSCVSLDFVSVLFLFRYCFPLEKGVALHLNKLESPFENSHYRRKLLNKSYQNYLSCSREEDGNVKLGLTFDERVEIGAVPLKKFLNIQQCIFSFLYKYLRSPLNNMWFFLLTN